MSDKKTVEALKSEISRLEKLLLLRSPYKGRKIHYGHKGKASRTGCGKRIVGYFSLENSITENAEKVTCQMCFKRIAKTHPNIAVELIQREFIFLWDKNFCGSETRKSNKVKEEVLALLKNNTKGLRESLRKGNENV